ncbi:MAG: magnesium transporter CorA family protein [Kiritimatiellae bacterium]|nr:magnesium transporter CorA family protein [Kiritimatiellia bacterium]
MMTIYKWENGGLKETPEFAPSCWINLSEPTTAELEKVLSHSRVPRDFLTDPLDREERPRFESEDGFHLVIVHVPYPVRGEEDDDSVLPYETLPLGVVLFGKSVITICSQATPVTGAFLDQIRRVCPPCEQNRFLFRLLWHAAVLFLRYLRDMHARTENLEDDLHESISNEALLKLLTYQKALVYFSTSLKADNILINRLDHARQLNMTEDDRDFLDDAAVEYQQALETATIHANILNGTMDTFASLINNNLSRVMKWLAVATVLLAVPTVITSAFGMNVNLPFVEDPQQGDEWVFWMLSAICGVVLAAVGGVLFYLRKRRVF